MSEWASELAKPLIPFYGWTVISLFLRAIDLDFGIPNRDPPLVRTRANCPGADDGLYVARWAGGRPSREDGMRFMSTPWTPLKVHTRRIPSALKRKTDVPDGSVREVTISFVCSRKIPMNDASSQAENSSTPNRCSMDLGPKGVYINNIYIYIYISKKIITKQT